MATGGMFLSTIYRRSGNFRVLLFRVKIRIYAPRFSDVERDYARQENVDYKELAAFVGIGPCSPTPISPTPVSPTLD